MRQPAGNWQERRDRDAGQDASHGSLIASGIIAAAYDHVIAANASATRAHKTPSRLWQALGNIRNVLRPYLKLTRAIEKRIRTAMKRVVGTSGESGPQGYIAAATADDVRTSGRGEAASRHAGDVERAGDDKRIILLGGGGHCKVVIDVLRAERWEISGILDPHAGTASIFGVPVLGADDQALHLFEHGHRHAFVAIGDNALRCSLGAQLRAIGFRLVTAIHPSATVSPNATLGDGVIVMPHAVINAGARVGALAIVNTGAIIEHDCILEAAVHAAPRSVVGGNVTLGDEVLLGIGATVLPGVSVGARTVVGAGAVVVADVGPALVVAGAPARTLKAR